MHRYCLSALSNRATKKSGKMATNSCISSKSSQIIFRNSLIFGNKRNHNMDLLKHRMYVESYIHPLPLLLLLFWLLDVVMPTLTSQRMLAGNWALWTWSHVSLSVSQRSPSQPALLVWPGRLSCTIDGNSTVAQASFAGLSQRILCSHLCQSLWYLWRTLWHWGKFFFNPVGFTVSTSIYLHPAFTFLFPGVRLPAAVPQRQCHPTTKIAMITALQSSVY